MTAVVVFEDKATDKARDTIRDDVWPGIVALEKGERLNELSQEVSGMIARVPPPIPSLTSILR